MNRPPYRTGNATLILLALVTFALTGLRLQAQTDYQTVAFDYLPTVPRSTVSVPLVATASSGLPVTFSIVSGPGTIDGNRLVINGAGWIAVIARQAGDARFFPAEQERSILVADPPMILTQPVSLNVALGDPVVMQVVATGDETVSYRWERNEAAVGTGPILKFASATTNLAGLYRVVVANAAGSVISEVVSVTIDRPENQVTLRSRGTLPGLPWGLGSGAPVRLQSRGDYAYIASGWGKALFVVDCSDPDHLLNLAQVSVLGNFGYAFDVALIDDFAITAERGDGLGIIDIRDPAAPVRIGNFKLPGSLANSIIIRGRTAFIGNENGGLVIVDLNRPESPSIMGSIRPPSSANGVRVQGNSAYVANWTGGLSVVDISDPALPKPLQTVAYRKDKTAGAVTVLPIGSLAYVADTLLGLVVLDPQNVSSPQLARFPSPIWDLARVGNHLFAADITFGMRVFDVQDPAKPSAFGVYRTGYELLGLLPRGNRILLAGHSFSAVDVAFEHKAPAITGATEDRQVQPGASITLDGAAMGTEPLNYRWFHDDVELPDRHSPAVTLTNLSAAEFGTYSVIVSNAFGAATNVAARLSSGRLPDAVVWDAPPTAALFVGEAYELKASSTTGRSVAFALDAGEAMLNGNVLTATSVGAVTLRAIVAGDGQHLPAAVVRTFTVLDAPRILTPTVHLADGAIRFQVQVPAEIPFAVLYSDDLGIWKELTVQTGAQNPIEITDDQASGSARFYRVQLR